MQQPCWKYLLGASVLHPWLMLQSQHGHEEPRLRTLLLLLAYACAAYCGPPCIWCCGRLYRRGCQRSAFHSPIRRAFYEDEMSTML